MTKMAKGRFGGVFLSLAALAVASSASAQVITYGDVDKLGFGFAASEDPLAGATLAGLAPGTVTLATNSFTHSFPFTPEGDDFLNTDQIFVGTAQTGFHDGYSQHASRKNGPQVFTLDYGALVPVGQTVQTLTLGIGADDFQRPTHGQPFTASVNGVTNAAITEQLNALNQTGPRMQFFTVGIDPTTLAPGNVLTLSINEGGTGGDGWAVDFLTVGVTTAPVPEPGVMVAFGVGLAGLIRARRRSAS